MASARPRSCHGNETTQWPGSLVRCTRGRTLALAKRDRMKVPHPIGDCGDERRDLAARHGRPQANDGVAGRASARRTTTGAGRARSRCARPVPAGRCSARRAGGFRSGARARLYRRAPRPQQPSADGQDDLAPIVALADGGKGGGCVVERALLDLWRTDAFAIDKPSQIRQTAIGKRVDPPNFDAARREQRSVEPVRRRGCDQATLLEQYRCRERRASGCR